jgi:sensor histidine kinase regulating citrate/malate metabolism
MNHPQSRSPAHPPHLALILGVVWVTTVTFIGVEILTWVTENKLQAGLVRVCAVLLTLCLATLLSVTIFRKETHFLEAQQGLEKDLRLQAAALESAANSIVITDRTGKIVWTMRRSRKQPATPLKKFEARLPDC